MLKHGADMMGIYHVNIYILRLILLFKGTDYIMLNVQHTL